MTCDWPKSVHCSLHFLKPEYRAKERLKKSNVLSDHLNYNKLKGYYGFFPMAPNQAHIDHFLNNFPLGISHRERDMKSYSDIKCLPLSHQSSTAPQPVTPPVVFHFLPLQKQHKALRWGETLACSSISPSSHLWKVAVLILSEKLLLSTKAIGFSFLELAGP